MKLSPKLKQRLRWQNRLFVVLLFSLAFALGWLTTQYHVFIDLTQTRSNYPSAETSRLLQAIEQPIHIKAFVSPDNAAVSSRIRSLIEKYQRIKPDISLEIIDPVREPQLVRQYNIQQEGELFVSIGDKSEKLAVATEEKLTNAINQLTQGKQDWILFLSGHNERSPFGDTSFDYGAWYKIMTQNGLKVRQYNLAENAQIPTNTAMLIIADPQKQYLKGEINILLNYLNRGGNLLWLIEPGTDTGLDELAETLGMEIIPGIIVDPNTQVVGINDPRFTLITQYPGNEITENLSSMSIFPTAAALDFYGTEDWDGEVFLETLPRTWVTETNINEVTIDSPASINGPLTIGIALQRSVTAEDADTLDELSQDALPADNELEPDASDKEQRIVVIGDSDFASDAYIGEAGNLDVAMNVIRWIVQHQNFIDTSPRKKRDRRIELSQTALVAIGFFFLLIMPVGLLITGIFIWRKRRRL